MKHTLHRSFILQVYQQEDAEYLTDYEKIVGAGVSSLYHVPDSWETYDSLKPVINQRFKEWVSKNG